MTDTVSEAARSYNMSRIRSKDTKPEMLVRRFLLSKGYRYRLHSKKLPGKPDIVLSKYKRVIFVHGCFWHGHEGCKYIVIPKTRTEWWQNKINTNAARDKACKIRLIQEGWQVIIIWECELKPKVRSNTLAECEKLLIARE